MIFDTMRVSSSSAFRVRIRDAEQIVFSPIAWFETGDWPSTASSWKDSSGSDINLNDYVNITYGHIATDSTKTLGHIQADQVVGGIFQTWVSRNTKFTGSGGNGVALEYGADGGGVTIADDTVVSIVPPFKGVDARILLTLQQPYFWFVGIVLLRCRQFVEFRCSPCWG